ncbi:MAG: SulP family inorganic anion transporter [Lewinellaceae bacterium]|nr:SulP family inorganic anion transporter [Saprospiraceae bacterium]MCB9338393.1 SulP family inorganic anion transporter [Lewinellaceae bacterium]
MSNPKLTIWNNLQYDVPAALVVFLVALPLCLGIALASGAPLFSGLIAGIVGGVVIGVLSKSPLSVSGPAAGLAVIVLNAIQTLPSFEAFLLAVALAGIIQVGLGVLRAGVIGDFIPSAVIKGMLAAIGLILILKQIPHAVGYDSDYEGDQSFAQTDGRNTFSELWLMMQEQLLPGAILISVISLVFLFWWDKKQPKQQNFLRYLPGPLVVVLFGIVANQLFTQFAPSLAIHAEHMVTVPVAGSPAAFLGQFKAPDFSYISNSQVWITAVTIALVASVETLLCIEAIDKLDPFKRVSPTNRELMAQGAGNFVSGLIGGIPITSVIVRSSANVSSGGRTRMAAILHGVLLLLSIVAIPHLLNLIPLSALAAILIAVGYKLTKPEIFINKYRKGFPHLVPFVITIVAILFTDLLKGIAIGLFFGSIFVVWRNYKAAVSITSEGLNYLVRIRKDLSFIHKYEVKRALSDIPDDAFVILDLTRINFVDLDNAEIINDFIAGAEFRGIRVKVKALPESKIIKHINIPSYESLRTTPA